jgi:hypothetical protein
MPNSRTQSSDREYGSRPSPGRPSIEQSILLPDGIGHGLLDEIAAFWREFIKTAFVTYYPERHYMRGPGPACAARRKAGAK